MRLSFGYKLTLAFASAVAVLLATAVVSYRNTRTLLRTAADVTRSQDALAMIDAITFGVAEAERVVTEERTPGAPPPRDRLLAATADVRAKLRALDALSAADALNAFVDSPRRHSAVVPKVEDRSVAPAVAQRLGALERAMAVRDRDGVDAAMHYLATVDTAASRGAVLAGIAEARERTRGQLRTRTVAARSRAEQAEFFLRFGLITALVLGPLAFLIVRNDFAVKRQAEMALAESEARFRAATDGSLDAFYVLRAVRDGAGAVIDFEFVDANARVEALLGHERVQVLGQRLCDLIPANRTLGFVDKYRQVMETGEVLEEEFEVTSGTVRAAWIHHQVVPLEGGVAITSRDISDRKRQEEALRALSLVDELTGLYNRRGFLTLAQQQLKLARRGHRELVLLFIDMDDFKDINDTYGHPEGDSALVRASDILRRTFRDSDLIGRLGGDEFVVLATDVGTQGSEILVQRLRRELLEGNTADPRPYRLSFSVGAARFDPGAPPTIEELLATADAMLYEQKRLRRHALASQT